MSQEISTNLEEESVWLEDAGVVARGNRLVGAVAGISPDVDAPRLHFICFFDGHGQDTIFQVGLHLLLLDCRR